jgi:hypothetical protein
MSKRIWKGLAIVAGCLALSGIAGTSAASAGTASPAASPNGSREFFSQATQTVAADGTSADITVANPRLAPADLDTSALIAVENQKQDILFGWEVRRQLFHDSLTHLFTEIFINGKSQGIDTDFKPVPGSSCRPGMPLHPGGPQAFAILQHAGSWQVKLGGQVCAYFPNTLWDNKFEKTTFVTWNGEVDAASAQPCTQMGDGQFASSPSAAEFTDIRLFTTTNGETASATALDLAGRPVRGGGRSR